MPQLSSCARDCSAIARQRGATFLAIQAARGRRKQAADGPVHPSRQATKLCDYPCIGAGCKRRVTRNSSSLPMCAIRIP